MIKHVDKPCWFLMDSVRDSAVTMGPGYNLFAHRALAAMAGFATASANAMG